MVDEILAQPVPRSFDARVHLASPRRALIVSALVSALMLLLFVGFMASQGLLSTDEIEVSLFVAFFVMVIAITPAWQFLNYRRARRLLTYGTVLPAILSPGSPTRGHLAPPIQATFAVNGRRRSMEFFAEPGWSVGDGTVLVLGADAVLYLPGRGVISARVT